VNPTASTSFALYSPAERRRRDDSRWTLVQGILAPIQFLVFLISLGLLLRYLASGQGWPLAAGSVVVKTAVLYTIMITGALWERDVFGRYLFAPAFFWEDVVSLVVLGLHSIYVAGLYWRWLGPRALAVVALAAYGLYLLNAGQFLLKLRRARIDERRGWASAIDGVAA
jgi:3-vinyl bacteriochlorophyllide hydratase